MHLSDDEGLLSAVESQINNNLLKLLLSLGA